VDVIWDGTGGLTGVGETVDVHYTTNGSDFTLWSGSVDADVDTGGCASGANLGCIRLSAPDAASATFQIRVQDSDDSNVTLLSGNNTVNGDIGIQSPAQTGPETYVVGDTMTITWIAFGGATDLWRCAVGQRPPKRTAFRAPSRWSDICRRPRRGTHRHTEGKESPTL